MSECKCTTPPFDHLDYETGAIGVDEADGRFGEVSVDTCRTCGAKWLVYFAEYLSLTASGRWYRGLVTTEMLASLTPEQAPDLLTSIPWRFYGGSYFRTTGEKGTGELSI